MHRRVENRGDFGKCVSCDLTQKLQHANKRWSVKLFVEESGTGKSQLVSLYHSMVMKLLEIFDSDVDVQTCSQDDLMTTILNGQQLQLKYDSNYKVTEMSRIDI